MNGPKPLTRQTNDTGQRVFSLKQTNSESSHLKRNRRSQFPSFSLGFAKFSSRRSSMVLWRCSSAFSFRRASISANYNHLLAKHGTFNFSSPFSCRTVSRRRCSWSARSRSARDSRLGVSRWAGGGVAGVFRCVRICCSCVCTSGWLDDDDSACRFGFAGDTGCKL